jgi:hypothetical protein
MIFAVGSQVAIILHLEGLLMGETEYLRRLGFEHELIERRIGWLLASQSLLLTGYALALGKSDDAAQSYRHWVSFIGPLLAIAVWCGVLAAILAKYRTWRDYQKGDPTATWGVRTSITLLGLVPDFFLPLIFTFVWVMLSRSSR